MFAVLAASLVTTYALVFMGIAWDSPTLALLNAMADRGTAGMSAADLEEFVRRHPFVESRVDAMVRSGVLLDDGSSYSVRRDIGLLVQLAELYRRVCNVAAPAG